EYDATKPVFIMYNAQDADTALWLQETLPGGVEHTEVITERPELSYKVYILPPGYDFPEP
ncbi:MAG TPA: hypothetical protein VJZ27_05895, partial [Aggregatilineales bacterium]|nr:hypothetical protein [Aggregatilineales bacterium]